MQSVFQRQSQHSLSDETLALSASRQNDSPIAETIPAIISKEAPYLLTRREHQVLKLVAKGKNNLQIAADLVISTHTAKAHVGNVVQKLFVNNRLQAAIKALKEGLS